MSNPYSSVSVSGYNASAPADDGTAVAANQLKWQNHLDKIGGPLKTAIESINTNVLSAFSLLYGNTFVTKSANYIVTSADSGRFIVFDTGATTLTLLAAATAGAGFPLLILNLSTGIVTVDGNSSETINGATTQELFPGDALIITCDGSSWSGVNIPGKQTGSFTGTITGFATPPTGTIHYRINGNMCTLFNKSGELSGTSNANAMTMTGLPAVCIPAEEAEDVCIVLDEGGRRQGAYNLVASVGTVNFLIQDYGATTGNMAANLFATSGTKGLRDGWQISYSLR